MTSAPSARRRPLLALDVDGTILTSAGVLTSRTRDALRAADRATWHIVLVTGRPLPQVLLLARDIGIGEFVVASNGATVAEIESGDVLYQATLPGALIIEALIRARRAVPGLRLAITTPRRFDAEPGFHELAPLTTDVARVVDDALPEPDDEVHSTVLFVPGGDTETLLTAVAAVVPAGVDVSPSGLPGSVELTPPGVHKGSGIAQLCARLGVDRLDVVAIGDGLNDHEMLTWAGHGVVMGNADPATKQIADEVTAGNDDDGVALIVEQLIARRPAMTHEVAT
jgi:Cof subfamily protein (haloacid dehalogenase superfamily)